VTRWLHAPCSSGWAHSDMSTLIREKAYTKGTTRKPASNKDRSRTALRAPKTRDPKRTSATILAAAIQEFSVKGYSGARVDAIAERAGINKRMLYHYFGDKNALYLAVLEGAYTKIRSAERTLHLSDRDPKEAIRELVRFTWKYFLDNPEFLSLLGSENLNHAKFLRRSTRIAELHSPLTSVISEVLQRGVRTDNFRRGIDPVQLYVTIASLICFYLSNKWTLSTIFRRDLMRPEELQSWGEHITDVVLSFVIRQGENAADQVPSHS
jgi:AcrR family transcriptional regulator